MASVTEKLTRANFTIWKALVLSTLKVAQLSKFLEDDEPPVQTQISDNKKTKMPNLEFTIHVSKQQQVLSVMLSSLSKDLLEYVAAYTTPKEVWANLVSMAKSQSCMCVINTCMALSTSRKSNLMIAQYVGKMKALADDMAFTIVDDLDMASTIVGDLDSCCSRRADHRL
jgi:hypothetical protein